MSKSERLPERYVVNWLLDAIDPNLQRILNIRFEIGRNIYNASLREAKNKKNEFYKQCKDLFHKKRELKKQNSKNPEIKKINKSINEIQNKIGYTFNNLRSWGQDAFKNEYITQHIKSHERNGLIERAFQTIEGKGKRKNKNGFMKVHFLRKNELTCISGENSTSSSLRLIVKEEKIYVIWNKTKIQLMNPDYNDIYLKNIINNSKIITYSSIVRFKIKRRFVYKVVITCEGIPPKQRILGNGIIGIDVNASTFAEVSDKKIEKSKIFGKTDDKLLREQRVLQRKLSRQIRANNPDCFEPSEFGYKKEIIKLGKIIKGKRCSNKSNRQKRTEVKLAEINRKIAQFRKETINKKINQIRSASDVVRVEATNKIGWQKNYGKSIQNNAPGYFDSRLEQVFNKTNGKVERINTYESALTQTCSFCGNKEKKKLGEDHKCKKCGFACDRDINSAIGAKFYYEGRLHVDDSSKFILENHLGLWIDPANDM